jgi:hypothetical protein
MKVQIDCPCAPRADGSPRHPEGDEVTLRETLDFRSVTAIRHGISLLEREEGNAYTAEILAVLTEGYVLHGIEAWTLVDDHGKPLPVSRQAIRDAVLADVGIASVVGDAADTLYGEKVLLPLLARASRSSQPSPTGRLTSPPTASQTRRPRPSRPSSTSTSPTAATVATSKSLDGVSSSWPSSESAA